MAKKKKPTLKSSVNRGFATTSQPSKKPNPEESHPTSNLISSSSAVSSRGNSTPNASDGNQDGPIPSDQKNHLHAEQIIKAMNEAGSENRQASTAETFDLEEVRQQELQSLVDKLAEKVDKEVGRVYKTIEFDRRLSKSLPAFVMDDKVLRDEILTLALAASSSTSTSTATSSSPLPLNGISSNPSLDHLNRNSNPSEEVTSSIDSPLQATSKTMLDLISSVTSLSFSESVSARSISSSVSSLSSTSATAFSETEEKFLLKALITHTLLRRLGFTRAQADLSMIGSGSLDLEECLAYLTLILSEEELEVSRKAADRGELRRDMKVKKDEEEKVGKEGEKKDKGSSDGKETPKDETAHDNDDDGMDSDDEPDETVPPKHPGYSFKRTLATKDNLSSKESQIQESKDKEQEDSESIPTSNEEKPSLETIQKSSQEVQTVLSSISEVISSKVDTLEEPTISWSLIKISQIQLDRLNSKRFKILGKKWALKDLDRSTSQIGKRREELRSLLNDAEKQPSFNRNIAQQLFRRDQLRIDDEELQKRKMEEQREAELKAALDQKKQENGSDNVQKEPSEESKGESLTEAEKSKQTEGKDQEKEKKENFDPYGQGQHDSKNEIDLDPDMNGEGSDSEEEPLFGDMLEETPTEISDSTTGAIVQVKNLPIQSKGGGGGKTGRTLLSDALKRVDPYSSFKFEPVNSGGRVFRSRLTLRWRAPGNHSSSSENSKKNGFVDVYTLTTIGCVNQNQADDLLAVVALSCLDKDKPAYRSLQPGFREWYDEISNLRKEEKNLRARRRIDRISKVLKCRRDEALEKKAKIKGSGSKEMKNDGQADVGALARSNVKEASEDVKEKIRESFRIKVEGQSYQDMLPQRQSLPIFAYREHILSVAESSQIFVLSGETGCGKSTQVPAYLLENCLSKGEPCKIYVTEPRRISAISLAERVSAEMGEPKGAVGGSESLVGYAIRLESNVGKNAKLVYATTGIVLRMLEGTAFNEITHVIIDEVHERSIESDFLLIILKTLLQHRSDLKVVLMSATVDAERISAYCGGCPTISVPGRTFPVDVRYLEDAVEMCDYTVEDGSPYARRPKRGQWNKPDASNMAKLASTEDEEALRMEQDDEDDVEEGERSSSTSLAKTRYSPKTISTLDRMDEFTINHDLIVKLLERICFSRDLQQYSAATLIFLPGIADIRKCHDLLTAHRDFGSNKFRVYPLHSTLTSESQASVFNVPPRGIRKIVIATNIAETGITIPDITCVVDSGKQREMRFDEKKQISRLVEGFGAKSNAKQRRGRAGRVQEGLAFHLFTKFRHDQYFPEHPLPEMLRLSLQDLALKLKVMKIRIGTSIEDALSQALDPPLAVNVQRAVSALVEVKALTPNEEITPLGRHLSRLPLDVHMAKFLLIATLFKCLDPALTIAAALNSKSPFITPFGREAEADRSKASFKTGDSDFFSIANAFNAWRRAVGQNYGKQFCSKCFLSQQTLMQIEELRQQYMAYLLDSGFAQVDDETRKEMARNKFKAGSGKPRFMTTPPDLDLNSNSMAILNAAISAGLYPKLLSIEPRSFQLRTIGNNQPVSIHPSSVNFRTRLSELPRGVNHLVYFTIMSTKKLYAWETGAVDDRGVMVLCGEADWKMSSNSLYIDRQKIRMSIPDSKTLLALSILREQLTRLVNTSFKNPGRAWTEDQVKFFSLAGKALGQGLNEKDQILQK